MNKKRGRPTKPAEERAALVIRVAVTAEEKAKFHALGGSKWLKECLKKERIMRP